MLTQHIWRCKIKRILFFFERGKWRKNVIHELSKRVPAWTCWTRRLALILCVNCFFPSSKINTTSQNMFSRANMSTVLRCCVVSFQLVFEQNMELVQNRLFGSLRWWLHVVYLSNRNRVCHDITRSFIIQQIQHCFPSRNTNSTFFSITLKSILCVTKLTYCKNAFFSQVHTKIRVIMS